MAQNKHIVLAGGGHAHMMLLADIRNLVGRGYSVTVVGPSPHHYYSGMGPGMLGGTYQPAEIRFDTQWMVRQQGGSFVADRVERVFPDTRTLQLASGNTLTYDVVSFNTGSHVARDQIDIESVPAYSVKPIETLIEARQRLLAMAQNRKLDIAVIGGGPSAAEIAGNLHQLSRSQTIVQPRIQIFAGKRFMSRFTGAIRASVKKILANRRIPLIENSYVQSIKNNTLHLQDGRSYPVDMAFLATGVAPSPIFTVSGLPAGPDGGLAVNPYLQSEADPNIFGGGDCIHFSPQPLDKVGVYAVRQNPVLLHNVTARLEGRDLAAFKPGAPYLLIFNLGHGIGVLHKRGVTFSGRFAFQIKNYLDRRFMQRFQTYPDSDPN